MTERATNLWCDPESPTDAAGPVFYGWSPESCGCSKPLFQAHFVIYTNKYIGREQVRIEDTVVDDVKFEGVLQSLNRVLEIEELKGRNILCRERREIVENIGFAD